MVQPLFPTSAVESLVKSVRMGEMIPGIGAQVSGVKRYMAKSLISFLIVVLSYLLTVYILR